MSALPSKADITKNVVLFAKCQNRTLQGRTGAARPKQCRPDRSLVYAAAMADKPDQWLGWLESKHTVRKFVIVCAVIAVLFVVLIWAFGG